MENQQRCAVVISPNPIKTKERLNYRGDVINPKTKKVITPKEIEPLPPLQPPEAPVESPVIKDNPLDIQAQIADAEAKVVKLKEARKTKIKEMEEELNKLKNQ